MSATYKQDTKNTVRHTVIKRAVELLTMDRSDSCCVRRSYVRDLYDYFTHQQESHEKIEAQKIDLEYIKEWERTHMNKIGFKRPDELSVCYLSGPEPENDFKEFVAMGVCPQNIWAFESEKSTYLQALTSIDSSDFMQPKIIKTSIERFFETSPKTFDIVYIDACASLISDKHALRCIATMFKFHRLKSPGVLISNFAYLNESVIAEKSGYTDIISRYNFIRSNRTASLLKDNGTIQFAGDFDKERRSVEEQLDESYGEFVSAMICNVASIAIPMVRFCNSNYLKSLSNTLPTKNKLYSFQDVNTIRDNTLYKYLAMNCFLGQSNADFAGIAKLEKLSSEISAPNENYNLLSSAQKIHDIRAKSEDICANLNYILDFFDQDASMYQFLDKPNRILFFDAVINQLSYPMHYVANKALRLTYIAKEKRMFTDLMLFDECRYIYDWLPAIHQMPNAFSNPSWQYTFRFALDGLIKQRLNYNNEFFFQGSVISKTTDGFEAKQMSKRVRIN